MPAVSTYPEAAALVLAALRASMPLDMTPFTEPAGREDGEEYLVPIGIREDLLLDDALYLVSKRTGKVRVISMMFERARIESMTPTA